MAVSNFGGKQAPPFKKGGAPRDLAGTMKAAGKKHKKKHGKKFIQAAIKRPGQLHRDLGVPQGQTIPPGQVQAAAQSNNKAVARRARFALMLRGLNKTG